MRFRIIVISLVLVLYPAGTVYADLTGTEGLAIDLSSAGAGTDFTIAFDPTELLGSRTWGDGSTDTIVWTFDRATGTDPTITFNNGSIAFQAITEGANAVYSAAEIPGGELGGTFASFTIDDGLAVTNWNLTTPTVTTSLTTSTPKTIAVAELDRLDGLAGIIVTDVTAVTDIEGTGLSIGAATLNWAAASTDLTDTADLLYETELDDFSEAQAQIGDKTLVNEEDAATWDALGTFSLGVTITTGDPLTLGVVRWDNGSDLMDGEQIAADTIDNDSIDWADMTDVTTDGAVSWGNIAEGELANSTVVTADIKDGEVTEADLNATNAPGVGEDNYVLTYNHAATNFTWAADATAGTTAWDDIANPDNSGLTTITFDNAELTLLTGDNDAAASFFTIQNTDADHAGGNFYLLDLDYSADDGDAEADFIRLQDSGGVVLTIQEHGNLVSTGTLQGTVITATTSHIGPLLDAAGDEGMAYGSADVDDHSFTTDGTGTAEIVLPAGSIDGTEILDDTVDSADYAAGSIDQEHFAVDVIGQDEMADVDHGDVAWSAGTASVESMDLGDATTGTYYVGLFADDTGSVRPIYADAPLSYVQATGTLTASEFSGGGGSLTGIDGATGDSATAFFDAGTIEHERGGLQADISAYTGLIAITGADTTAEIDALDELEGQLADVTLIYTEAIIVAAGTDPDVDAAGEFSIDTDGANEPNDVVLRSIDGNGTQIALAQEQKSFQATIITPNDLADASRDAVPIWSNETGMTFVITKIEAWSDTDDTTLNLEVVDSDGTSNNATVDALEIATGTGPYTVTETAITAANVTANRMLFLDFDDTDDPGWVKISICGYFLSDVN